MVRFSNYFVDLVDELEKSKDTLIGQVQLKLGINYCDAEDCFQEAYVGLIESSKDGRLDPNKSGRGYFCEILKNTCLNFLRNRKIRMNKTSVLDDIASFPSDSKSPLDEITSEETFKNVERVWASMPRSCYEAFKLYVVEGICRDEVAQRLGLRLNAVSVRVNRARKFLRKNIKN
ncbi:MAG: sigma-70 family RNA polymerase sigma factor [Nanoarchaeota archaeon]